MDIAGPGAAPPVSNLAQPEAKAPKTDESQMSIGEKLNRMAGVETEKSLYAGKKEMGKEAFLKLFMEQLKYQDPMSPVKNDQFNSQMAMFSQLEQQVNMNKNLEKMIAGQNNHQIAALQLVGKNITADRGTLYHEKDKYTAMNFKLPQDVAHLKIEVLDPNGMPVKAYQLGERNQGDIAWKWDGQNEEGVPMETGKYSYRVTGKGLDGKEVKVNTKVDGRVSGVTSANGVVFLVVGDQKVGLNDVEMIKEATAENGNSANGVNAANKPGASANPQVASAAQPKSEAGEIPRAEDQAQDDAALSNQQNNRIKNTTLSQDNLDLLLPLTQR